MTKINVKFDGTTDNNERKVIYNFSCSSICLLSLLEFQDLENFDITFDHIHIIDTDTLINRIELQYNIPKIWKIFGDYSLKSIGIDNVDVKESWLYCMRNTIDVVKQMQKSGVDKSICNILLQPYIMYDVTLASTNMDAFLEIMLPKYSFSIEGKNGMFRTRKDAVIWFNENNFHVPQSQIEWVKSDAKKNTYGVEISMLAESIYNVFKSK